MKGEGGERNKKSVYVDVVMLKLEKKGRQRVGGWTTEGTDKPYTLHPTQNLRLS